MRDAPSQALHLTGGACSVFGVHSSLSPAGSLSLTQFDAQITDPTAQQACLDQDHRWPMFAGSLISSARLVVTVVNC
jgi:hypothetical protein